MSLLLKNYSLAEDTYHIPWTDSTKLISFREKQKILMKVA